MSVLLGGLLIVAFFLLILLVLIGALMTIVGLAIIFSPLLLVIFAIIVQAAIIIRLFTEGDSYSPISTLKKTKWGNRSPCKPQISNFGWALAVVSGVISSSAVVLLVFIPFFVAYTSSIIWGLTIVAATSPFLFAIGFTIDERAIRQYAKDGGDISIVKSSVLKYLLKWNLELEYTNLGNIVSIYLISLITGNVYPILYITTRALTLGTGIRKQSENCN